MIEILKHIYGFYFYLPFKYGTIWEYLGMTIDEYFSFLYKHNALHDDYFQTKEDAEAALRDLEPYLVMKKLECK